jgi:predicted nucleic acid-binding protein
MVGMFCSGSVVENGGCDRPPLHRAQTPSRAWAPRCHGAASAGICEKAREYILCRPMRQEPPPSVVAAADPASPGTALVVLDTNVLLAALVFDDPGTRAWLAALRAGRLRALATPRTRAEWRAVLERRWSARWASRAERALTLPDEAWITELPGPIPPAPPGLRCRDPDDQPFIDLALAGRARWLLSRDRAVLRLARAAMPLGLCIASPDRDGVTPPG